MGREQHIPVAAMFELHLFLGAPSVWEVESEGLIGSPGGKKWKVMDSL